MTMDRGIQFLLDRVDVDESGFIANATAAMSTFQTENVIPEVDAYRYSKLYKLISDAGHSKSYKPAASTILNAIKNDITDVQDKCGAADLVLIMPYTIANMQDVTQDTAETDITGYQPSMAVSKSVSKTDPAYEYINDIRRHRKIMSDAYGQILNVDIFDKQSDGSYPAERQDVSIQIDSFGGSASDPLSIGYTYNYRGDPVTGKATIANGKVTFTPDGTNATKS